MVLTGQQLETGTIQYASRDGTTMNAFYSRPAEPGNYPGVIVTMEGMGLMDHHKDIAVRFAGQGYLAIAPDLYTAGGDAGAGERAGDALRQPRRADYGRPGWRGAVHQVAGP